MAYPNNEIRKQINNDSIKIDDLNKIENMLANLLFGLKREITDKSTFFCDEIKQVYYKWLAAAEIDVNNCPSRLRHFLFEFNEILERRGWKIESDAINRKNEIDLRLNEGKEVFDESFSSRQTPLKDERFKSLESKSYEDIIFKNRFGSSGKKAEQLFKQMAEQYEYETKTVVPPKDCKIM